MTTSRLILRQLSLDDLDNLVSLDSDPEVMRYINGGIASTREAIAKDFLPYAMSYYQQNQNLGFWAIIERHNHNFMGWIFLRPEVDFKLLQQLNLADADAVELGYRSHQANWSQGYMTEAALALIGKTAIASQVSKINAWALIENRASTRVMEKVGMKLQQEYLIKPEIITDKQLLSNSLVKNLLGRTLVKYQRNTTA
ncbi:MAG: GNAT family N-acetyltransferase [Cyanobacteria bacterium J06623_7]